MPRIASQGRASSEVTDLSSCLSSCAETGVAIPAAHAAAAQPFKSERRVSDDAVERLFAALLSHGSFVASRNEW